MGTPPGVSSGDFAIALEKFEKIVGKPWVFTSEADLDLYRDAYSPLRDEPDERQASAAVAPDSVEQIQEIVRIANQYKIPLYAISTGRNLGYGGSAPAYSGSVVLDLKRMNRILEVNEKGAYCLVEPGVSFFDLYRYVREHNLQVRLSLPDPGWGSPIGNALDHGVGRHVYRDHLRSHCGMEVVLASGEVIRTGAGAVPSSRLWQRFRYGFGPFVDDIFSQSNFGIVTKMGFHMLPEPDMTRTFGVSIGRFDDIDGLLDEISLLQDSQVLNCNGSLHTRLLSMRIPEAKALFERMGEPSSREWDELGNQLGISPWTMEFVLAGPEKVVQAQFDHVVERLSRFQGFTVDYTSDYHRGFDPAKAPNRDKTALGIASMQIFSLVPQGTVGHLGFSPIYPMTGDDVRHVNAAFQRGYKEAGFEWPGWFGGFNWFGKCLVIIASVAVSYDKATNRKTREGFRRLIDVVAEAGYTEYRTHHAFQDQVMGTYSFNNHALLRFHETIKDAVDPNGILAAGKCGIWPKHLRERRI